MSTLLAYHAPLSPNPAMYTKGTQAYLQTQVQSRTPVELVVMLYDGALKFLGQARDAMAAGDLVGKRQSLSRGLAIVQELQNMLNMDAGGEIAERLDGLYTYVLGRCYEANAQRDAAGIDEAIKLLTPLRDAWADISAQGPSSAA
ncbi:flagellar export chaperone FliS [Luteitalea sp.]|uniref:flagellar export chaperone FliS n=1 Tax=Luteitalea sp. TaxID=2004800 RepID=UPI0025B95A7B|nr:flagellar export chaperone FliS [Luteitalea sp.]